MTHIDDDLDDDGGITGWEAGAAVKPYPALGSSNRHPTPLKELPMPPNFPALREMALQRLRAQGSRPFTDPEAHLVGTLLGRRLAHDPDHPLIQAAQLDIDTLQAGPFEWLYGWLSPHHGAATQIPDVMAAIAIELLQPTGRSAPMRPP